ncbi:hypothetical protein B0H13DRAFT_1879156 [Mycena leptocephala]|nr:hypothetical protein B0H13DRAFT_1879156 [Mycena leptocephala]
MSVQVRKIKTERTKPRKKPWRAPETARDGGLQFSPLFWDGCSEAQRRQLVHGSSAPAAHAARLELWPLPSLMQVVSLIRRLVEFTKESRINTLHCEGFRVKDNEEKNVSMRSDAVVAAARGVLRRISNAVAAFCPKLDKRRKKEVGSPFGTALKPLVGFIKRCEMGQPTDRRVTKAESGYRSEGLRIGSESRGSGMGEVDGRRTKETSRPRERKKNREERRPTRAEVLLARRVLPKSAEERMPEARRIEAKNEWTRLSGSSRGAINGGGNTIHARNAILAIRNESKGADPQEPKGGGWRSGITPGAEGLQRAGWDRDRD